MQLYSRQPTCNQICAPLSVVCGEVIDSDGLWHCRSLVGTFDTASRRTFHQHDSILRRPDAKIEATVALAEWKVPSHLTKLTQLLLKSF